MRDGIPWIADFRDPLADLNLRNPPRHPRFGKRGLERLVFRKASAVLANADGAAAQWCEPYPQRRPKLHLICNGFDPDDAPRARDLPARSAKLIIHAGTLYDGRNPNVIIASMSRLRRAGIPEAALVHILLLGTVGQKAGFDAALYSTARQEGWLELQPSIPGPEARRMIEEADGLLLVQPQTRIQVPGKLFEYICIGRPILALVPRFSAVEQILDGAGVPHVCIYEDDETGTVDRKFLQFLRLPTAPVPYSVWFQHNFNAKSQTEQLAKTLVTCLFLEGVDKTGMGRPRGQQFRDSGLGRRNPFSRPRAQQRKNSALESFDRYIVWGDRYQNGNPG